MQKKKATPEMYGFDKCTARELEVVRLICEGKQDKQIGAALSIAGKTANNYRTRIYLKTNSTHAVELVIKALKARIVMIDAL